MARGMLSQGTGTNGRFSGREASTELCLSPALHLAPGQARGGGGGGEGQCQVFAPVEHHLWALCLCQLPLVLILIHAQE